MPSVEAIETLGRWLCVLAVCSTVAAATSAPAGARPRPQVAGLQVALRAHGMYAGPIDGVYGPMSARGLRRFQRRAQLAVDGRAGPATRRSLGPLGRPGLGTRTLRRGSLGWDVSVIQFVLARGRTRFVINGYYGPRTERAVRSFQRRHQLVPDGIAGPRTLKALQETKPRPQPRQQRTSVGQVRSLLDYWADHYGVERSLVRAIAWMESGYQPNVISSVGAHGVMQVMPQTWRYVETFLIGRKVPGTVSGNIRVGVAYIRELRREFNGSNRRALAAWHQGPASYRRHGPYAVTRRFVANVLALASAGTP